ncbi:hypothetical protein MPOCJGCO_2508 [Methylobacterium trifolii]|uniref:Uncharacterized protein n=1 Tax=Methylobacterium trifolii TaxID=1003092 RepID=A0ABQ4U0U2_9HYPH|nr:hypothetical protein MPOCJGCO_2508 [Methylobacterium trifolii]
MGHDPRLRGVAGPDQGAGAGDEIGEGVGLLLTLAVEVPAPALLGAAPDVGDGVDEAAVDQGEQVGAEGRRHQRAVGAVAVEQQGRRAVEGLVAPVQQGDRHLRPVGRGGEQPAGDVGGRVVPARHGLALAQGAAAAAAIVVPGLGRGRHRRVDEADHRRLEFVPRLEAERVGLLGEGHGVLRPRIEVPHDDARPGLRDLEADQVPRQEVLVADHHAGPVRHQVRPARASGRVEGGGDDLEVLGPVGVRQDEERLAPVLDGIDQQRLPRLDHARGGAVRVPVDEVDLGGLVVARRDREEGARLRLPDMHEAAGIALGVDRLVGGLRRAEAVAHDAGRPVVGVHRHVPEGRAVARPDRLPRGRLDPVVEVEALREVAHAQGVEFRSLGVGAPGQPGMVVRMDGGGDLEERQPRALPVAVHEDGLLGRPRRVVARHGRAARAAADQGMLPAVAVAGVVGEGPVGFGDAAVVLADAPAHLGDEGVAQRAGRGEGRLGMGVLGPEVGADVLGQDGRRLEHVLPVGGLQPGVVVGEGAAMHREGVRPPLGDRRVGCRDQSSGFGRHRQGSTGAGTAGCDARADDRQGITGKGSFTWDDRHGTIGRSWAQLTRAEAWVSRRGSWPGTAEVLARHGDDGAG